MRKNCYKIFVMLLALVMVFSALTACGAAGSEDSSTGTDTGKAGASEISGSTVSAAAALPPYELKWYIVGPPPQPDIERIEKAADELLKPINATLKIVSTDYGSYVQKMQMVIASGQEFDLCFTSNWSIPFYSTAASGAFLPLDDLLKQYAPAITETLPKIGWQAATVNGKIYAIPNYQIWARADELAIRKDLADKYQLDTTNLKTLDQLTPFLEAVKKGEPSDMIPMGLCQNYNLWGDTKQSYNFEEIGGTSLPGVIKIDDPTCQVVNQYTSPEYIHTLDVVRDWYLKGYVKKDASTIGDLAAERKAGKVAATLLGSWKPGGDIVAKQQFGGRDVYDIQFSDSVITGSMLIGTMTAVSKTSKDPARAVMFYDLLFKSKDLMNLITLGQEGKDYKTNADSTVAMLPNSGYDVSTFGWEFGNQFNQKIMEGQPLTVWEDTIKLNNEAKIAPDVGFNFDPASIATEMANIAAVTKEYRDQLETGSVDPKKVYPIFISKLQAAGSDKVIAEEQKQISAWLENKGK